MKRGGSKFLGKQSAHSCVLSKHIKLGSLLCLLLLCIFTSYRMYYRGDESFALKLFKGHIQFSGECV